MSRFWLGATFGSILGLLPAMPADAWGRGDVDNFATIPAFAPSGPGAACPNGAASCTSDIEGVAVGPDGTVYTPSFGFNSAGALSGYGELFIFAPNGYLVKHFPVTGSSPRVESRPGITVHRDIHEGANDHDGTGSQRAHPR